MGWDGDRDGDGNGDRDGDRDEDEDPQPRMTMGMRTAMEMGMGMGNGDGDRDEDGLGWGWRWEGDALVWTSLLAAPTALRALHEGILPAQPHSPTQHLLIRWEPCAGQKRCGQHVLAG